MSHVARSLAVPTYHIRPIGETVSCHNAHWWVPLPTVSPGFEPRSTSSLVRPRRSGTARSALYDHPFDQSRRAPAIETCSRCKKATVVAEPTQPPGTSVVPSPTRQPSAVPGPDLWQFFRVVACKVASSDPPQPGHAWIIRQLPQRLWTRQSTGPAAGCGVSNSPQVHAARLRAWGPAVAVPCPSRKPCRSQPRAARRRDTGCPRCSRHRWGCVVIREDGSDALAAFTNARQRAPRHTAPLLQVNP